MLYLVCLSIIHIAFDVFYDREATEDELEDWFHKCVNKDVDESYVLWIFSNADEHIKLMQSRRVRNIIYYEHITDVSYQLFNDRLVLSKIQNRQ